MLRLQILNTVETCGQNVANRRNSVGNYLSTIQPNVSLYQMQTVIHTVNPRRCHVLNIATDIMIAAAIKSLYLPRLDADVIADAEYSPGKWHEFSKLQSTTNLRFARWNWKLTVNDMQHYGNGLTAGWAACIVARITFVCRIDNQRAHLRKKLHVLSHKLIGCSLEYSPWCDCPFRDRGIHVPSGFSSHACCPGKFVGCRRTTWYTRVAPVLHVLNISV